MGADGSGHSRKRSIAAPALDHTDVRHCNHVPTRSYRYLQRKMFDLEHEINAECRLPSFWENMVILDWIFWFVLHTHGWIWPNPSLSVPWERWSVTTPCAVAAEEGDGAGPPRHPALGSAPRSHPRALATPSGGTMDFAWQSETNDNRHVFPHHCSSST